VYVVAKFLGLRKSSTPLAVAGCQLGAAEALTVANIADRRVVQVRGYGVGYGFPLQSAVNGVTWVCLRRLNITYSYYQKDITLQ
jgi:hypothetical protein